MARSPKASPTTADDDEVDAPVDGRVARRERNVEAVIDCVLDMFAEDAMFPTMEHVATRSGLSLRSLYRYFADPAELLEAAIKRSRHRAAEVSQIHRIGEGPFAHRLGALVSMRVRLYEDSGPMYRATVANAVRHARVGVALTDHRNSLRDQFELQFAPEIKAMKPAKRAARSSAGDLLCQFDSIGHLRRHRGLSPTETEAVLTSGLTALLL